MKKSIEAVKKAVVVAVVIVMTSAGAAFAVTRHVAGGTWDYGTNIALGVAWSNFWHPSKNHASSVRIGANVYSSPCVGARQNAYAERWRPPFTSAGYYYRFC
ncbi:MAG: lactococcin 972 family bacteriocin [Propionibacteriaceae bacterium]|nr:lactococcin 972 family bacteriocin [Propionibacteriaceae bacterium]